MATILFCIIVAAFLLTVCVKHIFAGLKVAIKKEQLKEKCLTSVVSVSLRKQARLRINQVVHADRKEQSKENRFRFTEFINDLYDSLRMFICSRSRNKSITEVCVNPSQYLKFCKVRKGNGPNVK